MCVKAEHDKLTSLISEALAVLIKNSFSFKNGLRVEGILGITIDDSSVCMVSIKENISSPELSLTVESIDIEAEDRVSEKSIDLAVCDLTTTGKYSELDLLLNPKKSNGELIDATLFNSVELDQIMKESNDEDSDKPPVPLRPSVPHTDILLNFSRTDDMPGCSTWDDPFADTMPLNLSESMEPQDLSTSPKKQGEKFKCNYCGKLYKNQNTLKRHRCTEQTDQGEPLNLISKPLNLISKPLDLTVARNDSDSELDEGQSFTCKCGKVLGSIAEYNTHFSSCTRSKTVKSCDLCGKRFSSTSGFLKHKRLHSGSFKFQCPLCQKGFFDKTHFAAHMDSRHRKVRRFNCATCKKAFFWKHHLKRHEEMHANPS